MATSQALIEAKLVPEEQKTILEQAMRPGGYADKLAAAAKLWALAQEYGAVIAGLPFLELVIVLWFGALPCQSGLSGWLRSDAIFSMVMIAGGWFCGLQLAPVFEELQRDPMTVAQRWQENQALPYQQRLEVLVPGVGISSYQLGGLGAALALIFLVLGLANTIVGLMELLGTVVMGCSAGLVIVSFFFLAVRCVTLAGILAAAKYVLTEIQVMGLDGYTSEDPLLRGNDPGSFATMDRCSAAFSEQAKSTWLEMISPMLTALCVTGTVTWVIKSTNDLEIEIERLAGMARSQAGELEKLLNDSHMR
eukprot:symbB.v1.2.039521.t1/scaffold6623.1/size16640/2